MTIWPKNSSSPSILTRRSMASLIDSSRPLCTLTTYQRLLLGSGGFSGFVLGGRLRASASAAAPPRRGRRASTAPGRAAPARPRFGAAATLPPRPASRRPAARFRRRRRVASSGTAAGSGSGDVDVVGAVAGHRRRSPARFGVTRVIGHGHHGFCSALLSALFVGCIWITPIGFQLSTMAPRLVHREQEDRQQDHRHQHHDGVLDQPRPRRPRHLVQLRLGGDQEVGEDREVHDPPGQPQRQADQQERQRELHVRQQRQPVVAARRRGRRTAAPTARLLRLRDDLLRRRVELVLGTTLPA